MSLTRRCAASVALAALPLALASAAAGAAPPQRYGLDPVHTRVMFAVSHAGFSQALGTVSGARGSLLFDRDDWRSAKLEVSVPLTRLDLGDAKWNAATLAAHLLDGKRHPLARFVSETVEPLPGEGENPSDRARVCGALSLRGVTRPLCMDVQLNGYKRHPLPPFRHTAGFSASARLSRAEFGIDAWKSVIGDEVELRIEAEAVRNRYLDTGPSDDSEPIADDALPPSPSDETPDPSTRAATPDPEPRR
ncbi:YceI family protein [Lysobacter sp. CA196]|uniref:YceI family protein n=1 Tax=Lysobacter sp. CA196 TaxID=3455606 RepID=UPI003F8D26AF